MPTYEYACRSCGAGLEVVQSFTDDALTTCGECGGALRKVFGAVGISFKGSGFYKTDSRKGSSRAKAGAASETGSGDGGSSGGDSGGGSDTSGSGSGGGDSGGSGSGDGAKETKVPATKDAGAAPNKKADPSPTKTPSST